MALLVYMLRKDPARNNLSHFSVSLHELLKLFMMALLLIYFTKLNLHITILRLKFLRLKIYNTTTIKALKYFQVEKKKYDKVEH